MQFKSLQQSLVAAESSCCALTQAYCAKENITISTYVRLCSPHKNSNIVQDVIYNYS